MSDSLWLNGSTNDDDCGDGSSNFFSAKGDNGICCWPYVCQSTIRLLYFPRMKFSLLHKLKFLLESVHHSGQDIPAVADPDLPGAVLPCRRNAKTISSPSLQIRIEKYHALTGGTTCNCAPSYSAEFPSYRAVAWVVKFNFVERSSVLTFMAFPFTSMSSHISFLILSPILFLMTCLDSTSNVSSATLSFPSWSWD